MDKVNIWSSVKLEPIKFWNSNSVWNYVRGSGGFHTGLLFGHVFLAEGYDFRDKFGLQIQNQMAKIQFLQNQRFIVS